MQLTFPPEAEALRTRELALLQELQRLARSLGLDPALQDALAQALQGLQAPFLLVVVGEFNAGKSALINALLGAPLLPEGVTPTTDRIHLLLYAEPPYTQDVEPFLREMGLPAPLLRTTALVDTPGTNAVLRHHELLTHRFLPRSDLVLFVTAAERPLTASESAFLERIREWGRKVVLVVNKVDLLPGEEERRQVLAFVREHVRPILGTDPPLFPVSAREGLAARRERDPERWRASGMADLEGYLVRTLDARSRIRLKLQAPLEVARRALEAGRDRWWRAQEALEEDRILLDRIDERIEAASREAERAFLDRVTDLEHLLQQTELAGLAFLDETVRLGRILDLVRPEKVRRAFQAQVVGDLDRQLERRMARLIDALLERELRLWQEIAELLAQRRREAERTPTAPPEALYNRSELLQSLNLALEDALQGFHREAEAARLARSLQDAVAQAALVEVGAVGLGAAVTALVSSLAADLTGILTASALAAFGIYLIPRRRRTAKEELRRRLEALRRRLRGEMEAAFRQEWRRFREALEEALAGYRRRVEAESRQLAAWDAGLKGLEGELEACRREILRLGGGGSDDGGAV